MTTMLNKDKQLSDILESTDVGDAEKQKLFNAQLERYLELREQKNSAIPVVRITSKEEEVELPETLSDEFILEKYSKNYSLLKLLKTRPEVVRWDKRVEVKIDEKVITGSKINDLVSDVSFVRARKNFNAIGASDFFKVLSDINMPKDIGRYC